MVVMSYRQTIAAELKTSLNRTQFLTYRWAIQSELPAIENLQLMNWALADQSGRLLACDLKVIVQMNSATTSLSAGGLVQSMHNLTGRGDSGRFWDRVPTPDELLQVR